MNMILLSPADLAIAAILILLLSALSWRLKIGIGKQIIISALRTTIQLLLIGLVLKTLFSYIHIGWVSLMAIIMLLAAGREVMKRQHHRFSGWWGYGIGTSSMFISSFTVTLLSLIIVIKADPWYTPQYAIPMLGMILGNTMSGISLSVDRLTQNAWQQKDLIEARLMLGHPAKLAIDQIKKDSIRVGMIPMINAMAAAGIITLPGMMTGQILAGSPPLEAVKYQILIMFLITAGTGFGTIAAITLGARRLFDERQRLRLDRLTSLD
jgi:putative ABC transport system permease protein